MNVFLRAKHWQIFLLTFGLPFLIEIVMIVNMMSHLFAEMNRGSNPDPTAIFGFFKFFPVLMLVFMATIFGWNWSVAMGLQKMLPPGVTMKTTLFKFFFFFPMIYILCFCAFFAFSFVDILSTPNGGSPPPALFIGFAVIFPLHLFATFCMFYNIYFIAKTIKTVEFQRPTTFSDFVGEFFLLWFFPVGVWFIQPKINKMQENYENGTPQISMPDFS